LQELEAKLEEDGRETSNLDELQRSLREELEEERKQHQKDLEERDFTTNQTRKKYQGKAPHMFPHSAFLRTITSSGIGTAQPRYALSIANSFYN
jgi:hypothetical protein